MNRKKVFENIKKSADTFDVNEFMESINEGYEIIQEYLPDSYEDSIDDYLTELERQYGRVLEMFEMSDGLHIRTSEKKEIVIKQV